MEVDGEGDTRPRGVLQDIGTWLENVHADKIEKTGLVCLQMLTFIIYQHFPLQDCTEIRLENVPT